MYRSSQLLLLVLLQIQTGYGGGERKTIAYITQANYNAPIKRATE